MARILLVDDNEEFKRLLLGILLTESHDVTCAGDGNEAIREVRSAPFDLVITDLVMPNKEGLETIREIRAKNPSIKIIAMTGGSKYSASSLSMADAFGASKTLIKPFSCDAFKSAVSTTLEAA